MEGAKHGMDMPGSEFGSLLFVGEWLEMRLYQVHAASCCHTWPWSRDSMMWLTNVADNEVASDPQGGYMSSLIPSSRSTKTRFAQMVEHTQTQLYAFVRGFIGDSEEARDVVQDTYVSAWKAAYRGTAPFAPESEETEVRKWLFHAAYCRAVSSLRHRGVIAWESLDTPVPPQPVEHSQSPFENRIVDAEVVRAALAELESTDAACLMLSVVQGFTSVEIAQIFGITPEAARNGSRAPCSACAPPISRRMV